MTVAATTNREQYATDGVTTAFTIHFPFFDDTDINAIFVDSGGASTTLAINTDFSVTGGSGSGGTLTTSGILSPLASGGTLTVYRDIPFTQEDDYVENDPLPADTLESGFDRAAMRDQQLKDAQDRAITAPVTVGTDFTGALPTPESNKLIGWNNDANGFENKTAGDIGVLVKANIGQAQAGTDDTDYMSAAMTLAEIQQFVPGIALGLVQGRNVLDNGSFVVNQRAVSATATADDTYHLDRHYALTQTGTVAASQLTAVADGVPFGLRLAQSQSSAQRLGNAQIVEGANCKHLRGQAVTFSGKVKISTAANLRVAILEWTGTEDAVTSDVVNDWASSTYTAGNFFNSTTLTVRAVSAALALSAATLTDFNLSATLGSTFNNLIVVAWTEAAAAQNVTLDFAQWQLEAGAKSLFEHTPFAQALMRCQRRYQKSFNYGTAVGQGIGGSQGSMAYAAAVGGAVRQSAQVTYSVQMAAVPTVTTFNLASANANWRNATGNTDSGTPTVSNTSNEKCITILNPQVVGDAAGNVMGIRWTAECEL